ncbi:hypothetical protein [Caldivirga maquilingensis]|uniref:PRC-barrel domain-containing protein n=1 Tax=Caldivirga maquilingensis (strain ATCC 700844 / DSM 13496 / JCM 10307 / IC-167) TaxID=397948 RepID=A8MB24_CALMQ|nr:hypothetical protein [Caldivirga maquilingensis]ABW02653.1 hypothetical protein Cmaq_1836 [Caldivirga maquilingensis IC-167]
MQKNQEPSLILGRQVFTENGWFIGHAYSIYTGQDGKPYILVRSNVIQVPIPIDLVKAIGDIVIVDNSVYPKEAVPMAPGTAARKYAYTVSGRSLGMVYDEYNYEGTVYLRIIGPTGYVAVPVDKVSSIGDVVIINQTDVQPIPLNQLQYYAQQSPQPWSQPISQPIQPTQVKAEEKPSLDKIANYYLYGFFTGIVALIAFISASLVFTISTKTIGNVPLIYVLNVIPVIVIAVASIALSVYSYMIKQSIMRREFKYALRDSKILIIALVIMVLFMLTFLVPALNSLWLTIGSVNTLYASPPILVTIAIYAVMIFMIYMGYVNLTSYVAGFKAIMR